MSFCTISTVTRTGTPFPSEAPHHPVLFLNFTFILMISDHDLSCELLKQGSFRNFSTECIFYYSTGPSLENLYHQCLGPRVFQMSLWCEAATFQRKFGIQNLSITVNHSDSPFTVNDCDFRSKTLFSRLAFLFVIRV